METLVQMQWGQLDPSIHTLHLHREGSKVTLPLNPLEVTPHGWLLPLRTFAVERYVLDGEGDMNVVVFDRERREIIGGEPVTLAPSFFDDLHDRIAYFSRWTYQRPGRLAVFTHVCNEVTMLPVFLQHYRQFCDPGGMHVLNHGSEPAQIDPFRNQATVVDMPRGDTDHVNIANFCGYYQRFLLTQYDWVIHIDCDELLLTTRDDNDLRAFLDERPLGEILRPAQAFDVTHQVDDEARMDWTQPVSLQRERLYPNGAFRKPVLASTPVTWSIGFHQCLEPVTSSDDLCIVHLRDADLDHAVRRDLKWDALPRSALDQQVIGSERTGRDGLTQRLRDQAAKPQTIQLPDWMRGRF
jgi:hypothetical protein